MSDAERSMPLRRAGAGDFPAIRAFLEAGTPEWRPQRRDGWLEWQYRDNPAGFDLRVAESADAIAAMSGFLPCRVAVDGTLRTAAFSTNTLVDERQRGKGLGRAIHEARLRDYDYALSSGQSAANHAVYMKLGFVEVGQYRKLLVQAKMPAIALGPRLLRQAASWMRWTARSPRQGSATVRVLTTVPEMETAWFSDRFEADEIGPVWNRGYLVWRYERHPYLPYRFVHVADRDASIGLAVVRESEKGTVVADLYCRVRDLGTLLAGVATAMPSPIIGQFVGARLASRFARYGWTSLPSTNRLLGRSNDPALHRLLTTRDWSFFGGDSDSDR